MMLHTTQHTLRQTVSLAGKGLHTGLPSRLSLTPAPPGTGIRFVRSDLGGASVPSLADHVSSTRRSTSLSDAEVTVGTVEHLLSALTGCGVDNVIATLNGPEVPILDGSARLFCDALRAAGLEDQGVPRRFIGLSAPLEVRDDASGAWIRLEPANRFSVRVTADFGSRVLGVQTVCWDPSLPYPEEIGCCRTFVFFRDIAALHAAGLVHGGDVDNAIVVVEQAVPQSEIDALSRLFGVSRLSVRDGYLDNITLRFPDECGRHKLLDLLGDLRLAGGFPRMRVTAYKPGHALNTRAALLLRQNLSSL